MILRKSRQLAIFALTLSAFASCKQKIADGNGKAALAADEASKKMLEPIPECLDFPDRKVFDPQLADDFKKNVIGGFYRPEKEPPVFNTVIAGADSQDAKDVAMIVRERANYVNAFKSASQTQDALATKLRANPNMNVDLTDVNKAWRATYLALTLLEDACRDRLYHRSEKLKKQ